MQEMQLMKKLVIGTSLILATFAASPAFAAKVHARAVAPQPYATATSGDEAYAQARDGLTTQGPAIYSYGVYAGWDPDPNIRLQLMKDPGALSQ